MASLSFSLGGSSAKSTQRRSSPPPKTTNGTKRDHAALLDDASDDEETSHAKRQTITHFDSAAGGAVNAKAPKKEERKPLVIAALANRDWREASKKQRAQKYGITTEQLDARKESAQNAEGADKVVKETEAVKYGLNVFAPSASASAEDAQQEEESEQRPEDEREQPKTADQLAIDALTGAAPTSTLTIPTAAVTEEDAFNDSYHSAPPAPSLSVYAAVPVEEYGAAMLRGMGWKGPSTTAPSTQTKNGKKQLPPAKRPALLGIGADPNAAAQAEELGAWGKSSSKGRKEPTMFVPVSMKNKKTGETLTEEELRDKIRRDKEEAENQRFVVNDLEIRDKKRERRDEDTSKTDRKRRDDYSDDEEEKRRRHRRKEKERDYDRHHEYKSSKDHHRRDTRDRSRDYESRRDRSRDHHSKTDRSRDHHHSKTSSSRRDRSRDRDYEKRDRDYEKSSSRRDRYDETSKSSRRDRSRDREYHRSSRR